MRITKSFALLFTVTFLVCSAPEIRGQNQTLVVEGGKLIDGTGANAVNDAVVVIEGNRFKAVGARGKISYPPNAKVIDARGKTIMPGLFDAHIHLRQGWMLPIFFHFGITTVYDLTNYTGWIVAQREALKKGVIKGPRLFVTGRIIDGPSREGAYTLEVSAAEHERVLAHLRAHSAVVFAEPGPGRAQAKTPKASAVIIVTAAATLRSRAGLLLRAVRLALVPFMRPPRGADPANIMLE